MKRVQASIENSMPEADKAVRSVERAVDILFSFTQGPATLGVQALQDRTGLSRPTLYRLLRTLESKGLIYSFGSPRKFQLGTRFGMLAEAWTPAPALVALAGGPLEQLWNATQETVTLMMPISATHRMCMYEKKSPQALSFSRGTGYTEQLCRGASGKVLLAHMPPEQQRTALAQASHVMREQAVRDMETAIRNGVLVTHGEIIAGTVAVASPVLTRTHQAVASVCIFGPALRLCGATLQACEYEAKRTAGEISAFL